ncbi:hypothetical protein WG66_000766, partial [Moniliophthora roreri]
RTSNEDYQKFEVLAPLYRRELSSTFYGLSCGRTDMDRSTPAPTPTPTGIESWSGSQRGIAGHYSYDEPFFDQLQGCRCQGTSVNNVIDGEISEPSTSNQYEPRALNGRLVYPSVVPWTAVWQHAYSVGCPCSDLRVLYIADRPATLQQLYLVSLNIRWT